MGLLTEHPALVLTVHSVAAGPRVVATAGVCVKYGFSSMLPPPSWHPFIDMSKCQHKKHNVFPCTITTVLSSTLVWILTAMYTTQNLASGRQHSNKNHNCTSTDELHAHVTYCNQLLTARLKSLHVQKRLTLTLMIWQRSTLQLQPLPPPQERDLRLFLSIDVYTAHTL